MKLSQFRFDLPLNLIAQHPTKRREDARLMVVHRSTGQIENKHFRDKHRPDREQTLPRHHGLL
jgi:S-adenosylmethionine:tRNA ribosyltransferase-isomerase